MTNERDAFQIEYAGHGEYVAVFRFDAHDCRGIAEALHPNDAGAADLLSAAEAIEQREREDAR